MKNRPSKAKANEALANALRLLDLTLAGGKESPAHFRDLLQHLLSKTILHHTSFIRVLRRGQKFHFTGPDLDESAPASAGSEPYRALKLNDGRFLYIWYEGTIAADDNQWLKIFQSKFSYRLDEGGYTEVFRFDHTRLMKNEYPSSHLHVNGKWTFEPPSHFKDLPKIHFPVVRPTIEGVIRILINDFGVESSTERDLWEPMLEACEDRFKEVMSTRTYREPTTDK